MASNSFQLNALHGRTECPNPEVPEDWQMEPNVLQMAPWLLQTPFGTPDHDHSLVDPWFPSDQTVPNTFEYPTACSEFHCPGVEMSIHTYLATEAHASFLASSFQDSQLSFDQLYCSPLPRVQTENSWSHPIPLLEHQVEPYTSLPNYQPFDSPNREEPATLEAFHRHLPDVTQEEHSAAMALLMMHGSGNSEALQGGVRYDTINQANDLGILSAGYGVVVSNTYLEDANANVTGTTLVMEDYGTVYPSWGLHAGTLGNHALQEPQAFVE